MINKELLELLVCPKCKGNILFSENQEYIICEKCKLAYTVNDDIPIMLIDTAVKLDDINKG